MGRKTLNIGIIGSRGIPANYGGFETFAEKLSSRLVEKGHKVTVYCPSTSSQTSERRYKGVDRVIIPNIASKLLDKLSNSFVSCLHSITTEYQVILFLGVSPVLLAWLPRLFGKKTVININGLDWKRKKWHRIPSFYLKLCESFSGRVCHKVVADSRAIQSYFKEEYDKDATFIAYGADIGRFEDEEVLKKYRLNKGRYVLQVCRIEPDNNPHIVIREYSKVKTDMPLIILGDAQHSKRYMDDLKNSADDRVRFLGGIYGYDYDVIRSNPFCHIHAHEAGGTNPSLLESLAAGNCSVVLDVVYNIEVTGDAGLVFSKDEGSLLKVLQGLLDRPESAVELGKSAVERIRQHYTWDKIVNEYEDLFYKMLR